VQVLYDTDLASGNPILAAVRPVAAGGGAISGCRNELRAWKATLKTSWASPCRWVTVVGSLEGCRRLFKLQDRARKCLGPAGAAVQEQLET